MSHKLEVGANNRQQQQQHDNGRSSRLRRLAVRIIAFFPNAQMKATQLNLHLLPLLLLTDVDGRLAERLVG